MHKFVDYHRYGVDRSGQVGMVLHSLVVRNFLAVFNQRFYAWLVHSKALVLNIGCWLKSSLFFSDFSILFTVPITKTTNLITI